MLNEPEARNEIAIVAAIQRAVSSALTLGANQNVQLRQILQNICAELGADCAIYWSREAEEGNLSRQAYWSEPMSLADAFVTDCTAIKIAPHSGLPGKAIDTADVVTVSCANDSPDVRMAEAAEHKLLSAAAIPINGKTLLTGVLELFFADPQLRPSNALIDVVSSLFSSYLQLTSSKIELLENEMLFRQMSSNIQSLAVTVKESARKERAIIEQALDVICSLDDSLTIVKINPASVRIFGQEPQLLAGRQLFEFSPPGETSTTIERFKQAKQECDGVSFENTILQSSGRLVHVSWSVHWSISDESFFCVARDIGERKELERLKQEFVAMISHDIRTPLMSVTALLSSLSEGVYGNLSDRGLKRVQDAQHSIDFVIQLVNSILELEQLGSGQQSLLLIPTDMGRLVELAVQSVTPLAEQRSLTFISDVQSTPLLADETRLARVLINLLGNAIKYSPDGSRIEIQTIQADNHMVEVRISDSGRGVPETHRQKIFQRFQQVERADATVRGGIGLGLAICKEIVELHGGCIGVDNSERQGSTFWFRVPRAD